MKEGASNSTWVRESHLVCFRKSPHCLIRKGLSTAYVSYSRGQPVNMIITSASTVCKRGKELGTLSRPEGAKKNSWTIDEC